MPFFNSSLPSKIFYSFIVSEILCLGRNSRSHIRDDIDMKLGPVTKLDKRNKATSQIVTSLLFFQFMAILEESRSRIFDALAVKFTFSKGICVCTYVSKFKVSSIILTNFRQEVPPPPPR